MTRWRTVTLLVGLVASGCRASDTPPPLSMAGAVIRGHTLTLEVAADPLSRERGLMFRRELAEGSGMLFVYLRPMPLALWMRNTFIPLSAAFVDEAWRIVNIVHMQPFDETTIHRSAGSALYAIEVPLGWFERHGVVAGDSVDLRLPPHLSIR
jgi:hypothetical protein